MIEIFGKDNCPYCVAAKQLAESKKLDYEYKTLGVDFTREEVLEQFPGARTFPQIKVSGTAVGGYEELRKYLATAA